MKKMTAGDPASRSSDLIAENLEQMRALFPEAFTEGRVDCLNWHGKRQARQLALTPSTGTLRPCPEDSVDWDTTQNLMIEGDKPGGAQAPAKELLRQGEAHIHRSTLQHR